MMRFMFLVIILMIGHLGFSSQEDVQLSTGFTLRAYPQSSEWPTGLIFIGQKNEAIQLMKALSKDKCLLHGIRDDIESFASNDHTAGGLGVDDDGNGYIDDRYGWQFSAQGNKPVEYLSEVQLSGEWTLVQNGFESTNCSVIFPVFLEDSASITQALDYLINAHGVLAAFRGPLTVYHSSALIKKSLLSNAIDQKNFIGRTNFSLVPF